MRGKCSGGGSSRRASCHQASISILGMTDRRLSQVIDSDTAKTLGHQLVLTVTSGETGGGRSAELMPQEEVEFQGTICSGVRPWSQFRKGLGLKEKYPTQLRRFFGFARSALGPADRLSGVPVSPIDPATLVSTELDWGWPYLPDANGG